MNPSLQAIAHALGGRVHGNFVVASGPEAASHKTAWKRRRYTLTVWINADGDIGVNSHTGQDPIATKDWVRRECGLPAWERKKRKLKPLPPLRERSQYLGELLRIARDRKLVTFDQFALIINDLKNTCSEASLKSRASIYAREFAFSRVEMEAAMRPEWRAYTASERAAIFQITYDEYRRLGLRRSGCAEFDAAERRRRTRQRDYAKRRVGRAAKRASMSADPIAPLCPPETVGTVRVPSSEAVELVGSRDRTAEVTTISTDGLHAEIDKSEMVDGITRRPTPIRVTLQLRLSANQRNRNDRTRGSKASQADSGLRPRHPHHVLAWGRLRLMEQRNAVRLWVKNNRRNQMRWPEVGLVQEQDEKRAKSARQNVKWPKWRGSTQRQPCSPLWKSRQATAPPQPEFPRPPRSLTEPMESRRKH